MIKCPRCGTEVEFKGNPYRPFCSDRCKQIDLGNWISENYRVPTRNEDEREDEDAPGQLPLKEES
jgi:uncharacterized protein